MALWFVQWTLGTISQMIYELLIEILWKFFLHSFRFSLSNQVTIMHMLWQLHCPSIYKIVMWLDDYSLDLSETNFTSFRLSAHKCLYYNGFQSQVPYPRLLHSPNLMAIGLSVGYEASPFWGWLVILPRWSHAQFGNSLLPQYETMTAVTSLLKSHAL